MEEGDARQQTEAFFGAGDQTGANPETGDQQGEKRKRDDYDFDSSDEQLEKRLKSFLETSQE